MLCAAELLLLLLLLLQLQLLLRAAVQHGVGDVTAGCEACHCSARLPFLMPASACCPHCSFCHWPQPAYFKADGTWVPSQTNFTSLATPTQIGSGRTALVTLLHEGGHAAHFANVLQRSPFFRSAVLAMDAAGESCRLRWCTCAGNCVDRLLRLDFF